MSGLGPTSKVELSSFNIVLPVPDVIAAVTGWELIWALQVIDRRSTTPLYTLQVLGSSNRSVGLSIPGFVWDSHHSKKHAVHINWPSNISNGSLALGTGISGGYPQESVFLSTTGGQLDFALRWVNLNYHDTTGSPKFIDSVVKLPVSGFLHVIL